MGGPLGQRAVVVGAEIGGLSMAGALAKHFERVEIFERDRLTARAASRSGTPRIGTYMFCWLVACWRSVRFSRGFESDLVRAGAVSVKVAQDFRYERADVGVLLQPDFGMSLLCASRPLIELVLRRRTEAITNISLRPEGRVTEIVPAPADAAVSGVRFDAG